MTRSLAGRRLLGGADTFCFACHAGVPCFTRCCRDADMYLYPYDVIRLKRCLGLSSDRFLADHTLSAFRDNPYFPSVMLKMTDKADRACPFLTDSGCRVYPDRPYSCRAYPLERAVGRAGGGRTECYAVARHNHCRGHEENRRWTVDEWIADQQMGPYHEMNDLWVAMDTLFRGNPWGEPGVASPALGMAFMACFNVDHLRKFVLESSFLSRFRVETETLERLRASDEAMMRFGFDWVRYFLTGQGPLAGAAAASP